MRHHHTLDADGGCCQAIARPPQARCHSGCRAGRRWEQLRLEVPAAGGSGGGGACPGDKGREASANDMGHRDKVKASRLEAQESFWGKEVEQSSSLRAAWVTLARPQFNDGGAGFCGDAPGLAAPPAARSPSMAALSR